jgi:hypothetical protein
MKEIAADIYIEQNSLGLFTGIIQSEKGMVLIDSPLRPLENGLWKGSVVPDECCKQCYMVVLDTNYDRLLSIKGSDCAIVAHSAAITPIRSRTPRVSEDSQQHQDNPETVLSGTRMLPPEIIFDSELSLHVDGIEVDLEHHAGSNHAGIWVVIPERNVVFVGDTVVVDQPPFLAYANLETWEADLETLSSEKYADYQVVSSRSGVVNADQIKAMIKQIANIRNTFEALKEINAPIEDWHGKIPQFLGRFSQLDLFNSELFYNRLHWGITTYYEFNCREKG